jgi:hypothetical protein
VGVPVIVPSPSSGLPGQMVQQFISGNGVAGVYLLVFEVTCSDLPPGETRKGETHVAFYMPS